MQNKNVIVESDLRFTDSDYPRLAYSNFSLCATIFCLC